MSREVFDLNKIGYNFIYFGASQPLFAMLEPGAPLRLRAPEHAALAPGADMENVPCKPCAARVNFLDSGKFLV